MPSGDVDASLSAPDVPSGDVDASVSVPDMPSVDVKAPKKKLFGKFLKKKSSKANVDVSGSHRLLNYSQINSIPRHFFSFFFRGVGIAATCSKTRPRVQPCFMSRLLNKFHCLEVLVALRGVVYQLFPAM